MSQNAEYKPNSIEDVQKNWIELLLQLFSKATVLQHELQSAFENKYGIKLPEGILQRYARQLEETNLITYRDGVDPTTAEIKSCYRLTRAGSDRLDYLLRTRGGEVMTMKGHRTIYALKKDEPLTSVQQKIAPQPELLIQSIAKKPEKKENSELPTEDELKLCEKYGIEAPIVLGMLAENEISGNELKSRVDSELGYTTQDVSFFALVQMLETADAIKRISGAEFKQDLGKSKYKTTIKGESLLSYLKSRR